MVYGSRERIYPFLLTCRVELVVIFEMNSIWVIDTTLRILGLVRSKIMYELSEQIM